MSTQAHEGLTSWVITVDMGLGHQRAVHPFGAIAEEGILDVGLDPQEAKLWRNLLKGYEFVSRTRKVPVIGLAGETVGAVVLSFSRNTAIRIVSKFEGRTYTALGSEVIDGVGELINIIAGNAKEGLHDFRIEISLPGVITGTTYEIHWPEAIPVVTIPFESEVGAFSVNVSLRDLA